MAHNHIVADSDMHFTIDPATREITNGPGKATIIQNDHNSERFTFELPKIIDGHDMTACNVVQVHYLNIDAATRTQAAGIYEVDDLAVSPNSEDTVAFTWLLSRNATQYVGSLNFVIRFSCVADDGTVEYAWHTAVFSGITIQSGIYNSEVIAEEYADILEQWKAEIMAEIKNGSVIVDQTYNPESENAQSGKAVAEAVNAPETDQKFFDIDYDGIISLKPEYRGNPPADAAYINVADKSKYFAAISDNGVGLEGSKIAELPENIVIPDNVNGEQVTGFAKGMFAHNLKIKKVVLPSNVKTIMSGMFRDAIYLEKVENTEQIESVKAGAFYKTRVQELHFPNLTELGGNVFYNCWCLRVIDIGKVTSIGNLMFYQCENLSNVLGGANVTTIGELSFYLTRRLKNLSFLANVTKIGECAFWASGCNLETVPSGCSLGNYATYKKYEDNDVSKFEDYWSAATFTPCKNPLNSLFHQKDPRWANKQIGSITKKNQVTNPDGSTTLVSTDEPLLYSSGCAFFTLAEIYSAFENVHFDSPEEFAEIIEQRGLSNLDPRWREEWCQMAEALGYEVVRYENAMTSASLQAIYDALADGALVYKSVMAKPVEGSNVNTVQGGHVVLGYGINTNGEMLISDTSMHCSEVGIYENHKSALHIYKHGSKKCDAVIVKKVNA